MANIAIFGGSFNPPHQGHYKIVTSLKNTGAYKKIIIVPAWQNPLKKKSPIVDDAIRLKMLHATFDDLVQVEIDEYELHQREISYTYKTVNHFHQLYPDDSLFLVLGEDSYLTLPIWAQIDEIARKARFIVFRRPDMAENPASGQQGFEWDEKIEWRPETIPEISATQIRLSDIDTIRRNHWMRPRALSIWKDYITSKNVD